MRWSFAGAALSLVILVSIRQFRVLAHPLRRSETGSVIETSTGPVVRMHDPETGVLRDGGTIEWLPQLDGASSGD
ncbi:MAG: hypothetical protein R3A46_00590 [Thermomicrobiales bacterium]